MAIMTADTREEAPPKPSLPELIEDWELHGLPHCSRCLHARVHGEPSAPMAHCRREHGRQSKAHGGDVLLARLIRPKHPLGFRAAGDCEDWERSEA